MKDRRWFTILNLHLAVAAALAIVVLVLAVRSGLAVHAAGAADSASYQQQRIQYVQLRAQMAHLQGLPQKVDGSRGDAQHFYQIRIAPNYSTIIEQLDTTAVKNQVRLSNTRYTGSKAIEGLTEVHIDASLSGDYTPLMHFINDLERDKDHIFFIIDGLTFTGQQGGLVNLRLRLSTFLQAGATDIPSATDTGASAADEGSVTQQQEAP
jgi:type IV pilus assembly protein PilO